MGWDSLFKGGGRGQRQGGGRCREEGGVRSKEQGVRGRKPSRGDGQERLSLSEHVLCKAALPFSLPL